MRLMSVAGHTCNILYNALITRVILPTADFVSITTSTSTSTTPTIGSTSTLAPSPSSGLSSAAIGGIAGGIVGGFVFVGAILGFIIFRRIKAKSADVPPPVQQIDYTDPEYVGKPEPENVPNQNMYPEDLEPVSGRTNLVY
jgi:hypothetical protein